MPADTGSGFDLTGSDEALATSRMVRIASSQLFHGQRSIVIVHRGQEYRLHITKTDKLILTK